MKNIFSCILVCFVTSFCLACYGYKVSNGAVSLIIDKDGNISSLKYNGTSFKGRVIGKTGIEGYIIENTDVKKYNGQIIVSKAFINNTTGRRAKSVEKFFPTENSIRWTCELTGDNTPCSAPIQTIFQIPEADKYLYWTTWGRPQIDLETIDNQEKRDELKLMNIPSNNWLNPLVPIPFSNTVYYYGAPYVTNENPMIGFCPFNGDIISVPVIVLMDDAKENGITFSASLEDYIQDLTIETTKDGTISFARYNHRIVDTNTISFTCDIVGHSNDWRESLGWVSERYKDYFEPSNSFSKKMGGTAAYTNHDVDFDVQKMKDMAFSVNWRASFDFPYMGMFLPPVLNRTEEWNRFGGRTASLLSMDGYSTKMKEMGFFVLNYFNVTEFGSNVSPSVPSKSTIEGEEWKNCNDYLYGFLEDAILTVPEKMNLKNIIYPKTKNGGVFYTWEDAVIMDCGVKSYSDFLLEQTRRHIKELPNAYGFCIDRMDWLRMFNIKRDDGRSWFDNQPVSSMVLSWTEFMEPYSKLVHDADKVIFVNNHTKRIDLLKHVDGIFDEFTNAESPLNLTAFLTLKMPFLGWTPSVGDIKVDGADNFFQKYLYMGAFPMCPFPGNDHSIRPDEWGDEQYLDYGALMKLLNEREWVLENNPVKVISKDAKANIFKVGESYIIPVVFAKSEKITIEIGALKKGGKWNVNVLYPGEKTPSKYTTIENKKGKVPVIEVPVSRGCVVLQIHAN